MNRELAAELGQLPNFDDSQSEGRNGARAENNEL